MDVMTLREFTDRYGQSQAGSALGTTQMAVSKALASGRNISIKISESGDVEAFEIRPFPSTKRAKKNSSKNYPTPFKTHKTRHDMPQTGGSMSVELQSFLVGFFSSLFGGLSVALPTMILSWLDYRVARRELLELDLGRKSRHR